MAQVQEANTLGIQGPREGGINEAEVVTARAPVVDNLEEHVQPVVSCDRGNVPFEDRKDVHFC